MRVKTSCGTTGPPLYTVFTFWKRCSENQWLCFWNDHAAEPADVQAGTWEQPLPTLELYQGVQGCALGPTF